MKKICLYLLTVATVLLHAHVLSAQVVVTNSVTVEISNTFASLFESLRKGDVRTITLFLSPEEYADYKVLFEQNEDYPAFLQKFYEGATWRMGEIHSVLSAKDDVIAEFIVDFPGGDTTVTGMRLQRNKTGEWRIRKVLTGPEDQGEPSGKGRR